MNNDSVQSRIEQNLRQKLDPERLEIINESHLHAGHQESFDGKGETHFRIIIVSKAFSGMSRIARHRAVNELVQDEMANGLHAIAIDAKAPQDITR